MLKSIDELNRLGLLKFCETYDVTARRYIPAYSSRYNYYNISYNNGIKKDCPIANECRTLIVYFDTQLNVYELVARGFSRFFNQGETPIHKAELNQCVNYEKLDGSFILIFWCPTLDRWLSSTKQVIENDNYMESTRLNIRTKGTRTCYKTYARVISDIIDPMVRNHSLLDRNITYLCELVGPDNRIVINYEETRLVLLSARDKTKPTHPEFAPEIVDAIAEKIGWDRPKIFFNDAHKKKTSSVMIERFVQHNRYSTVLIEGVVAQDTRLVDEKGDYYRVKVKSNDYVAIHKALGPGRDLRDLYIEDAIYGIHKDAVHMVNQIYKDGPVLHDIIKQSLNSLERIIALFRKFRLTYKRLGGTDKEFYKMIGLSMRDSAIQHLLFFCLRNPYNSAKEYFGKRIRKKAILHFKEVCADMDLLDTKFVGDFNPTGENLE